MSRFRQDTRGHALRLLDAYWTDLSAQAGGDIPARSAIDPRGLETVLDRIFILERIAPGFARIRLSGIRLNSLAGMDVRGLPLSALFTPDARDMLTGSVTRLFAAPASVDLLLEAETGPGRAGFPAEMLMFPLRDNAGEITRAIGAFSDPAGPVGRTPRRFAIARETLRDLGTPEGSGPTYSAPQTGEHRAFAEEAEPLLRPGPNLRVISGRDPD